jgi:GNAT superfamily N-acetyltransferase
MGEAVMQGLPEGLTLTEEVDPPAGLRAELAAGIHAFHAGVIGPWAPRRLGLAVRDGTGALAAGLSGLLAWDWLFIEAVFVAEAQRGTGLGALLMARAEASARAAGCRGVWLDTFAARPFYEKLGYVAFGELPDYPAGHRRAFLMKRLDQLSAALPWPPMRRSATESLE